MTTYRDDPDYLAALDRRGEVSIGIARLTLQLDQIQLRYLRDGVLTSALERASLVEQRSALRLEMSLLTDAVLIIKTRGIAAGRKDLLDTLVTVLNENGLGRYLTVAADMRRSIKETA